MKRQKVIGSDYVNLRVEDGDVDVIDKSYNLDNFYTDYITKRKPVKLINYKFINNEDFKIENIQKTLKYDEPVQVERKVKGGYGSGSKRLTMTLNSLVNEFVNGNDEFYLTTQYEETNTEQEKAGDETETNSENEETEGIGEFNEDDDELSDKRESEEIVEEEIGQSEEVSESEEIGENDSDLSVDTANAATANAATATATANAAAEDSDSDFSIDMNNLQDDYEESEDDEIYSFGDVKLTLSEAEYRVKQLLQPPLTNLTKTNFPIIPPIFNKLIPQQINLWMGMVNNNKNKNYKLNINDKSLGLGKFIPGNGTSSGLHHDHADNLYILIQGRKRFTIYAPPDGNKLYTIGKIFKIFNSGIIDYQIDKNSPNWKHIRDDGAIIEEINYWLIENEKNSTNNQSKIDDYLNKINQEINQRNKFIKFKSNDPPNFSKIPPLLLHLDEFNNENDKLPLLKFAEKHFPEFLKLKNYKVWLEPGDIFYLPAGWFHEVSSFGINSENHLHNVHIALNYWFIPPNDNEKFYSDDYWNDDWKKTQASLNIFHS